LRPCDGCPASVIDFVVLLAIGMDASRNYDHYVDGDSPKIDEALGNTNGGSAGEPGSSSTRAYLV
jgi:hypothetical protein